MSGPRVFGLPHLSEDAVAACADGVLSAAAMSRARRHCAECAECADAVRGQRETAMLLRTAQAPALPSGLLDRLAGLPMSASLPPSRGGLPTVLDADGTAMFLAYDGYRTDRDRAEPQDRDRNGAELREAGQDGRDVATRRGAGHRNPGHRGTSQPDTGQPDPQARQAHRRGTLPVTVLASAAAVVAAGTLGSHVSTLAAAPTPAGAASVAGSLAGARTVAAVAPAPLSVSGSLLATGSAATESAATGSTATGSTADGATSHDRTRSVAGPSAPTSVTVTPSHRAVWQPRAASGGQLPAGLPPMPIGLPTATP